MYDVVIPYKENNSLELQYAVRGIIKNLKHNSIYIMGDGKTGTTHVPRKWVKRRSPYLEVESKTMQACESLVRTDHFWFTHDDIFIMRPMETKTYHKGPLKDTIARRKYNDIYTRSLKHTYDWLRMHGIDEPLSYELHIPMLFNTRKRIQYSEMVRDDMRYKDILVRTVYGNMEELGGEYMDDVKNPQDFNKPFLSSSEGTFKEALGDYIRKELG